MEPVYDTAAGQLRIAPVQLDLASCNKAELLQVGTRIEVVVPEQLQTSRRRSVVHPKLILRRKNVMQLPCNTCQGLTGPDTVCLAPVQMIAMDDADLLEQSSTSPVQEGPGFVADVRATLKWMLQVQVMDV